MKNTSKKSENLSANQVDYETKARHEIRGRFFRALNYLSINVFIVIVYGSGLIADYLLFALMWWLLSEDVINYPLVEQMFNFARIGLAILFITSAIIHGAFSTYSQIKLDYSLLSEDGK